jgi:hypothetical protein
MDDLGWWQRVPIGEVEHVDAGLCEGIEPRQDGAIRDSSAAGLMATWPWQDPWQTLKTPASPAVG